MLTQPSMNALTLERPALSDLAKFCKDGVNDTAIDKIANVLMKTNSIIQDAPLVEANGFLEHLSTYETSMPKAYVYEFNRGVPASHASVGQRRETLSMFSARSEVDANMFAMYDANGAGARWRYFQDERFIRAMNDAMSEALFYGDSAKNNLMFNGLATRYNTMDDKKSQNAKQVVSLGGKTGAKLGLSSIYAVAWGETTCHGLYPNGGSGTLRFNDLGKQQAFDDQRRPYTILASEYFWTFGIAIPDFTSVVRICNIDIEQILKGEGMGTGVMNKDAATNILIEVNTALRKLDPNHNGSKVTLYANKDVMAGLKNCMLRSDAIRSPLTQVLSEQKAGTITPELDFFGYTIKQNDAISSNEAEVK